MSLSESGTLGEAALGRGSHEFIRGLGQLETSVGHLGWVIFQ